MASNVKKGKKKKGTAMSLQEFLGPAANELVVKKSWGDEMEQQGNDQDENDFSGQIVINRSTLPTAPRSARGANVDLSLVPSEKPFKAFIGNLPFEVTQEDIKKLFKDMNVVTVRLQTDSSGRMKGYGYVEFETKEMLIDALSYNDANLKGRTVRVDLADQQHGQDRDRQEGGFRNRDEGDDKTLGDWRRKEDHGSDRYSSKDKRDDFDQGPDRGERDRYDGKGRYSSDRFDDRGGEQRRGWSGGRGGDRDRDRDRYHHFSDRSDRDDRDRDRDFGGKSSFGSSFKNRDSRDHYSFDRDRNDDRYGNRESWNFRSNERYRSEGRGRNDDRYRGDDRYRSDDRYRNSDRNDGDRYERRDDRYHDGDRSDRFRESDRSERPRDDRNDDRNERSKDDRERDNTRSRDRRSNDRSTSHEGDEDDRGHSRDHSPEAEKDAHADRSRDPSKEREKAGGPKGRPRLNLQKRTKPIEEAGQMASASSSIFGEAKPVDTTQKLREIEEKQTMKHRQKSEKDSKSISEDDQPASVSRQASLSEVPASEETNAYKRQNSAGSKNRPKKEATQDGNSSDKRRDRPTTASTSSSKGGRKSSHNDLDETSSTEVDITPEKPAPPQVKMVPAPPPKENIWEKRKTEAAQQQQQHQPSAPVAPEQTETTKTEVVEAQDPPKEETGVAKVETAQPPAASHSSSSESSQSQTTSEEKTVIVADAPKVNVWEARKKEAEARSQKPEKQTPETTTTTTSSHQEGEVRKKAVVSVAGVGDRGGSGMDRSDRRTGGTGRGEGGSRGGGRGGVRKSSDGGDSRRSDERGDNRRPVAAAVAKKDKEKQLPASFEDMPKLEDKSKKDWSDKNKFSSLLLEEDNADDADDDKQKASDDENE